MSINLVLEKFPRDAIAHFRSVTVGGTVCSRHTRLWSGVPAQARLPAQTRMVGVFRVAGVRSADVLFLSTHFERGHALDTCLTRLESFL